MNVRIKLYKDEGIKLMEFEKMAKIYNEVTDIMLRYYKSDKNIEFPELLFCEYSYNKREYTEKRSVLACLKTVIKYDSKLKERIMVGLPIIVVYRKNIKMYLEYLKLDTTEKLEENIYRIYFIHELIHFFQLKDKPPYSKYIGKNYKPFEETSTQKFFLEIEKECVFTIRQIIKAYYNDNEILKNLWSLEMIDFKRLYLNDRSDSISDIVNQINALV